MPKYALDRDSPLGVNMSPSFSAPYPVRQDACLCPELQRECDHCKAWRRKHPPTGTASDYYARVKARRKG